MRKLGLLILLLCSYTAFSQQTPLTVKNFTQYVINYDIMAADNCLSQFNIIGGGGSNFTIQPATSTSVPTVMTILGFFNTSTAYWSNVMSIAGIPYTLQRNTWYTLACSNGWATASNNYYIAQWVTATELHFR